MSHQRIKTFVDWLISSHYVTNQWGASSDDWINDPARASRCHNAAEHGADGSTHAERIQDMRDGFAMWLRDRRSSKEHTLFQDAVNAHFDDVEAWHERAGSLHQEIG